MTRERPGDQAPGGHPRAALRLAPRPDGGDLIPGPGNDGSLAVPAEVPHDLRGRACDGLEPMLLDAANAIYRDAAARGEQLSQRALARQLRDHGHRFPNGQLRAIAVSIGLPASRAA